MAAPRPAAGASPPPTVPLATVTRPPVAAAAAAAPSKPAIAPTRGAGAPTFTPRAVSTGNTSRGTRRSLAWVYYSIVTVVLCAVGFHGTPTAFAAATATGLYAVYLARGGRIVIWIW